jgi:hypothetical protein
VKSLPSVSLYIRITDEKGRRRYERIRRRSPQMCGEKDVFCLHFYEKGKRKWLSVGTDLVGFELNSAASHADVDVQAHVTRTTSDPSHSDFATAHTSSSSVRRAIAPRITG